MSLWTSPSSWTAWKFGIFGVKLMKKYFGWSNYFSQSMGFLYAASYPRCGRFCHRSTSFTPRCRSFIRQWGQALAISAKKPLFYSQRGNFHPMRLGYRGLKKRIYIELFEKPIMRGATGLIALTPDEIDSYRALGINSPCHIIPNGIDVARFRRAPATASLSAVDIRESDQVVLFLGRLHPSKGVDVLLNAFFQVISRHPESLLVIAGPDEHGFAAQLLDKAAQQNLEHRILIPGMVTGDLKTDLLARADLFVLTSVGEGQSMAILEALASGTPVIISPECNFPDVEEVKAGAIVERDANLVAQAISRFFLSDFGAPQRSFGCGVCPRARQERGGRRLSTSWRASIRVLSSLCAIWADEVSEIPGDRLLIGLGWGRKTAIANCVRAWRLPVIGLVVLLHAAVIGAVSFTPGFRASIASSSIAAEGERLTLQPSIWTKASPTCCRSTRWGRRTNPGSRCLRTASCWAHRILCMP